MKSQLLWTILGAVLVLMLGVAAAACGDDDKETDGNGGATPGADAEGYYSDVDRIQNALSGYLDDLQEQSQDAYGDPEKATVSLSAAKTAGEEAVADLNALEAPSVAATAHTDLVSGSEALIDALEGMLAGLEGIEEPGQEYSDWLGDVAQPDSEFSLAVNQLRDACRGMQDAADNSRVEIVFQCPI